MRHLTVRNVPEELARQLQQEQRERGLSLNQTVIDLLSQATGIARRAFFDNGLGHLAGTWSPADLAEFEQATKAFEVVDAEMWR
jgi:Ran GTPase-activating protein (RanGAP) involved in mRNA processing and transport